MGVEEKNRGDRVVATPTFKVVGRRAIRETQLPPWLPQIPAREANRKESNLSGFCTADSTARELSPEHDRGSIKFCGLFADRSLSVEIYVWGTRVTNQDHRVLRQNTKSHAKRITSAKDRESRMKSLQGAKPPIGNHGEFASAIQIPTYPTRQHRS